MWANSLLHPTYEKLDRILMSTEWELQHPMSTVLAMPREILDHTPLLLDTGNTWWSNNQPIHIQI
jgi:hypothetical protein